MTRPANLGIGGPCRRIHFLAIARSLRADEPRPRDGSVLLLILVVVAMLTLSAFTFFDLTFNYRRGTDAFGEKLQATATAESGVEFLMNHLKKTPFEIETAGGLYNNPAWFQGVLVVDDPDPRYRARFSILSPAMVNGVLGHVRFGVENESARINLNTLLLADDGEEGTARTLLLSLPGMTEFIADAILDWIDEDDEPREFGAELETYSARNPPYMPANGPLTTIEELLLVEGVTPELLYGADVNRNYYIDEDEAARQTVTTADSVDGSMSRGWSAFLTIHSAETNIRADGTPKIDVNGDDLELLHDELTSAGLTEGQANFIIAYRQGGSTGGSDEEGRGGGGGRGGNDDDDEEEGEGGGGGGGRGGGGGGGGGGQQQRPAKDAENLDLNFETPGNEQLTTILDLIGTETSVVESDQTDPTPVNVEFPEENISEYLPLLMENLSVNPSTTIPGRININQAPASVLYGIPGLAPYVDQIISMRDYEVVPERPGRAYETWLLTEGIVTLDEMRDLMKYITAGGSVYRAQVVGFSDQADSPKKRLEVIVDNTTQGSPKMVFWRDLSQLGGGFTPEVLGLGQSQVE